MTNIIKKEQVAYFVTECTRKFLEKINEIINSKKSFREAIKESYQELARILNNENLQSSDFDLYNSLTGFKEITERALPELIEYKQENNQVLRM